jgi:hypothetical protein
MSSNDCSCPPFADSGSCAALPPGFSRLRYFFGKRLAVADFIDEQRYHTGKQRFHNQRLHGAGILCGLGASLLEAGSNVVRVGKGAALDRCGHEIVVGYDHCIDVDAWYRRELDAHRDADPTSTWPSELLSEDGKLALSVVLRYSECPSKPESAPRDPCSCAEGGSDYGRVNEEFELSLLPAEEAAPSAEPELFPTRAEIDEVIATSPGGPALVAALTRLVTAGCPEPTDDDWLVLATFRAVLSDDQGSVASLEGFDGTPVVLSTAVLQHLLLAHLMVAPPDDHPDPSDGPEILEVTLEKIDPTHYRFILHLSGELVGETVQSDHFRLVRLTEVGWDPPGSNAMSTAYVVSADGPQVQISFNNPVVHPFLEGGGYYRLSLSEAETEDPIVDSRMRRLTPAHFAKDFTLVKDGDTLRLSDPPYIV